MAAKIRQNNQKKEISLVKNILISFSKDFGYY